MGSCQIDNIIKIITGSYKQFTVTLIDEESQDRLDLTNITSASIIILTGQGTTVTKEITVPIPDPKLGAVTVELLKADTALLDSGTKSFELEFVDNLSHTTIYIGKNLLEVTERLKP